MRLGLTMAVFEEMYDSWAEMWQPGGIGYLASYLESHGPGVEVVIERDLGALIAARPDVIGLSATTYCYGFARDNARKIKESLGVPVVIGGPHVTLAPEHIDPIFDVAVLGEGEETLRELMVLFAAKGSLEPADLAKVAGIAFWDEGRLRTTDRRAPIAELDTIPTRARGLLRQWGDPAARANLYASRGCPFTCRFCSTVQVWGRKMRRHSPEYVADEIEHLRTKHDTRRFFFNDDLFALHVPWVEAIAAELTRRRLVDDITIRCTAHVSTMTHPMMTALSSMNVRILDIGLESGSTRTLTTFGKGATREDNDRAMEMLREYGIQGDSCFIFGAPGEDREDVRATFEFIYNNLDVFDDIAFGPVMPLPGTPVFRWAQDRRGTTHEDLILRPEDLTDWDRYVFTRYPYLNDERMPLAEMVNYVKIGRELAKTLPGHIGEAYMDPRIGEQGRRGRMPNQLRRSRLTVEGGGKGEQRTEIVDQPVGADVPRRPRSLPVVREPLP
jgi:anaerobic magnesium-protoporphyrin IX monomethyl ester cyclase